MRRARNNPPTHRLQRDPISRHAHGLCAELLPEAITLDDRGYPIIDNTHITADLLHHARRAASACPTLDLTLNTTKPPPADPTRIPTR